MGIVPDNLKKQVANLINDITYRILNAEINNKHDVMAYIEYLEWREENTTDNTLHQLTNIIKAEKPEVLPFYFMKETLSDIICDRLEIYCETMS